jgi:amino acid transporter
MLAIVGIMVGLFVACAAFAMIGVRIGAQIEAKKLGAGITEEQMKGGWTASGLGGVLGVIPFLVFVAILIVMVVTAPPRPGDGAEGGAPAAAH